MGSVTDPPVTSGLGPDMLLKQWKLVLRDPALRELPYRIETNKWGHIEMTPPASPRHMEIATALVDVLRVLLGGKAFTECAVVTQSGVKVVDLVWCSAEYLQRNRTTLEAWEAAFPTAPDLCIEIMSPSNTLAELEEKLSWYLAAGAREAWIVARDLAITAYDSGGKLGESSLGLSVEAVAQRARALLA